MSGSPKYSFVRANAERRRQLELDRQQREERRRAERTWRAAAELDRARWQATQRVTELSARCVALGQRPGTDQDRVRELLADLRRIGAEVRDAADVGRLSSALRRLAAVGARLSAADAERAVRVVRDREQRLAVLRAMLADVDDDDRRQLDPMGHALTERLLAELAAALRHDDIAEFDGEIESALSTVEQHRQHVLALVAQRAEQRAAAAALIGELAARLAGLVGDARAADVELEDLELGGAALDLLRDDLAEGRPDRVVDMGARLSSRLDRVERSLDAAIERITSRREMLSSIIGALPDLGFTVLPESLTESPDGGIGVRATLRSGNGLTVLLQDDVEEDHRISYLRGSPSAPPPRGAECAELIDLARRLNESVRGDGFEPGAITWDGQSGGRVPSARRPSTTDIRSAQERQRNGE
jgi:hypothetical protein